MTDRYIRDGMVAVLISDQHGAGWSTWVDPVCWPDIMFDPWIVDLMLSQSYTQQQINDRIRAHCAVKYLDCHPVNLYSAPVLKIHWVPVGSVFRIVEYDGLESIEFRDQIEWLVA